MLPPNLGIGVGKAEYLPTGHSGPSRIEGEPATGYSQNGLFDPPPRNILDPMHGCHFVERIKTCIGRLDAVVAGFSGNIIETEYTSKVNIGDLKINYKELIKQQ